MDNPTMTEQEVDAEMNQEPVEETGTSIELMINEDGTLSVSMEDEAMETEGMEDNAVEVGSLEEALAMIKQMAEGVMQDSQGMKEEEDAYKAEMSAPMGAPVGMG